MEQELGLQHKGIYGVTQLHFYLLETEQCFISKNNLIFFARSAYGSLLTHAYYYI